MAHQPALHHDRRAHRPPHHQRTRRSADTLTTTLTYLANLPAEHPTPHRAGTPDTIHYPITTTEPLRAEHEAFRDTVLGHHPPATPLHDALRTVLIADAALQAARTGATITITPAPTDPGITPAGCI